MIEYVRKIERFADQQIDRQVDELVRIVNQQLETLDTNLAAHVAATAAHGATGAVVGTTNSQTLTNKTLTDPIISKIVSPADLEVDCGASKTIKLLDSVWNDIQFNMTPLATGVGHPTLAAWNTDFEEWSYAVNDHANAESQETPHWWKEGSVVSFHMHWTTGSGNYVSGDKVQFQLKVSAADAATAAPFTAFPAATTLTVEMTFNSTVAPFSHVLSVFSAYTLPATWTKIGAQIKVRLARIAKSAGGTDPGTNPFVLQVGCHAETDTMGSRTVAAK